MSALARVAAFGLLLMAGTAPAVPPASSATPAPATSEELKKSQEIARLRADIEARQQLYSKRPRRKYLTAASTVPEYAAFLREFVEKIEKAGTAIYPEAAMRSGLSGKVLVSVEINRDGSLREIIIHKSSGVPMLDTAAKESVRRAAPFSPLPVTKEDIDILEVTQTFLFKNGGLPVELSATGSTAQKTP